MCEIKIDMDRMFLSGEKLSSKSVKFILLSIITNAANRRKMYVLFLLDNAGKAIKTNGKSIKLDLESKSEIPLFIKDDQVNETT